MEWFIGPFKRFADFSGRSGPGELWPFAAANILIIYGLAAIDHSIYGPNGYFLSPIYFVLVLIPLLSLLLRCLRNAGRSEYFIFLLIIGIPGLLILLVLLAWPSVPSPVVPPQQPENETPDLGESVVKTLTALFCYLVTIYWILALGRESALCGSPAWPQTLLFAAPFIYLLIRLFMKWNRPWPAGSGAMLGLYLLAVVIIAIASPYFSGLQGKSIAGATRGKLKEMRAQLAGKTQSSLEVPPDIKSVIPAPPELRLPYSGHPHSSEIRVATFTDIQDSGRWLYDGRNIYIDCTHKDLKEAPWSSY